VTAETARTLDTHVSPLAGHAERLAAASAASHGALHLAEVPFLAHLDVRLDPKSRAAEDVAFALGLPLPLDPCTSTRTRDLGVLWLGPDEWLVVGPAGQSEDLAFRVRTALGSTPASVVDVSSQRTTLVVGGPRARDLLAHGCALDLHPRVFGEGRCAATALGRCPVVLVAREVRTPTFRVLVRSSFAGHLADWLLDAAVEDTGGPG